jgi:hypothetical protein
VLTRVIGLLDIIGSHWAVCDIMDSCWIHAMHKQFAHAARQRSLSQAKMASREETFAEGVEVAASAVLSSHWSSRPEQIWPIYAAVVGTTRGRRAHELHQ